MKYGQTIRQAWLILKRTKLLWLYGLIYFLSYFLEIKRTNNLGLECVSLLLSSLSLFLMWSSQIGMILCTDKVIRGELPAFKEIWREFKSNFWRLILLYLALLIPCGILFLCALLSLVPINALFDNVINDTASRIFIASWISSPFTGGIIIFSYYGLILHKMGVLKSIRHGFSVLSLNWLKLIVLSLFLGIPGYISYLIFWLILLSTGTHPTLINLFQAATRYPVQFWFRFLSSFVYLFSSVTFLLTYHQFIKDFDYPTLRQITNKT